MPIAAAIGISAAAGLGSAAIGANAAGNAAKTQANAATTAAQLEAGSAQQALNFQKQQYNTSQQELAPWLQSGQSSLANLDYLLGIGPNGAPGASPEGTPQLPNRTATAPQTSSLGSLSTAARPIAPVLSATNPAGSRVQPGGVQLNTPGNEQPLGGASNLGVLNSSGVPRPGVPQGVSQPVSQQMAAPGAAAPGAIPPGYGGQTFNSLVNSNDPNVSPNQQTTQQWRAQGIPFQNITTSDGRTVSIRTDQAGPQASVAPPTGIQSNLSNLVNPDLGAYGSLSKGWDQTFQAPTGITEQNDPGFQARLNLGTQALQNSAAARGGLLTGGTARDLSQFGQDYASNEYGNVYNRAFNEYATRYNQFQQNQTNQYNRLASIAGIGQQTASNLGMLGQNSANNSGNILMNSAAQQGQQYNNAAAATASGYVGSANAYGGALSGIGNNLSSLAQLYGLMNQNGTSSDPGSVGRG